MQHTETDWQMGLLKLRAVRENGELVQPSISTLTRRNVDVRVTVNLGMLMHVFGVAATLGATGTSALAL